MNTYTDDSPKLAARIEALTREVLERIAPDTALPPGAVEIEDGHLGEGGIPTEAMAEAVRLVARTRASSSTPCTGKAMAGLSMIAAAPSPRRTTSSSCTPAAPWHSGSTRVHSTEPSLYAGKT